MKLVKNLLLGLFALTTISIVILFIIFWRTDPRLCGTFKSDKEATIKYLESTRDLNDRQKHVFNLMYGHLKYIFDGHKIRIVMEPHVIHGYAGSSDLVVDESITESYYFVRMSNNNSVTIVVLPSPFWNLDNIKIIQLEFDSNDFWLEAELYKNTENPLKEKFSKIS